MNATTLTIDEAARCLPELVDRVHETGESATLTKAGQPLARIVPIPSSQGSADLIAFLRRWHAAHPEPDEQFGEAVAEVRTTHQPPRDPWE